MRDTQRVVWELLEALPLSPGDAVDAGPFAGEGDGDESDYDEGERSDYDEGEHGASVSAAACSAHADGGTSATPRKLTLVQIAAQERADQVHFAYALCLVAHLARSNRHAYRLAFAY